MTARNLWTMMFALVFTSAAGADAVVELLPDAPGPYAPGQEVTVEVVFTPWGIAEPDHVRGLVLDFSNADPTIGLPQTMEFTPDPYSHYSYFRNLPSPALIWMDTDPLPEFMIEFPPDEPVTIGWIDVVANDTGWLDVFPAWVGLVEHSWSSDDGTLTGGRLFMEVPEPISLMLMAFGAIPLLRRRPRSPASRGL